MHRRIADRALARLTGERSSYFARVIDQISRDHGSRSDLNLVYLLLAGSMELAPTALPESRFTGELLAFIDENRGRLNATLYSRAFIAAGPEAFDEPARAFSGRIADICMKLYRDGAIEDDEPSRLVFTWPDYRAASPYVDPDE